METTSIVVPVGVEGRRNRKWSNDLKAQIAVETLVPGGTVTAVSWRHGMLRTICRHGERWR